MTIVWVDDVTPLDAAHMNELEQVTRKGVPDGYASLGADGLVPPTQLPAIPPLVITDADIPASITRDTELAAGLATKADTAAMAAADMLKVDKDSVVAAATRVVASRLAAGDAQPTITIRGDGLIALGPGGATPQDVFLYRRASDGAMRVDSGAGLSSQRGIASDNGIVSFFAAPQQVALSFIGSAPGILFGPATDTNVYRQSAGVLRTDGRLDANALSINGVPLSTAVVDITGKVDKDSVVVAATRLLATKLLAGDAQPTFRILGDGKMQWGSGGAAAPDVSLYYYGGGLRSDRSIFADQGFTARQGGPAQVDVGSSSSTPMVLFGGDTTLYRVAAAVLQTDGGLNVGTRLRVSTAANLTDPSGGIYFGAANDTNLYRYAANTLKTDGTLRVGGAVSANFGAAGQIHLDADGHLYFGSALDTNLYRSAASTLKTDGRFVAGTFDPVSNARVSAVYDSNGIEFGHSNAGGYRSTLGGEATTGYPFLAFSAEAGTNVNTYRTRGLPGSVLSGDTAGGFRFSTVPAANADNQAKGTVLSLSAVGVLGFSVPGAGVDANLYRQSGGMLKTDGSFRAGGGVYANAQATNQISLDTDGKLYFNAAFDTNLYRSAANVLKTDGAFTVGTGDITLASVGSGAANQTAIVAYVGGLGLRRIEAGAADSGGAGFRALRVSN